MIRRGNKYRLYPTDDQAKLFSQYAGVVRLVFNLALEQRRDHWRAFHCANGRHISMPSQCRELTALRAEYDFIRDVCQTCQQQALRDLDTAFTNFFSGNAKYPTPRRKGVNDSFRFQGREIETRMLNRKWSEVRLPKIGWVRFRDTRPMRGKLINATITANVAGWHISFTRETKPAILKSIGRSVGIDLGVANTLALSTGEMLKVPTALEALERRHRTAQRVAARRKRGSKRRSKAILRCAKLAAKRARIRRDWQHKVSTDIANRFGVVVLENLNIGNMTASARGTDFDPGRNVKTKAGLNRSILNQGWGGIRSMLEYKIQERGGKLVTVDARLTSQTCSHCGAVDRESRKSQAIFSCTSCGYHAHADQNAAVNILRRNTACLLVEGEPKLTVETRTFDIANVVNPASAGGC